MKTSILALAITGALMSPVLSADVFESRGSLKDDGVVGVSSTKSGFYITGSLGVAEIDRSASRTIDRETGIDAAIDPAVSQADIDTAVTAIRAAGVDVSGNLTPGGNIVLPVGRDQLGLNGDSDLSSTVFGAEAGYLYAPGGRLGFSLGVGATFYGDAESGGAHVAATGTQVGGTVSCPNGDPCAGTASLMGSQSGAFAVDRDFDIDLIARMHVFLTDRLALNAGGGLSLARASIAGVNGADVPSAINGYGTAFDQSDTSIGYVLTVGADYWLTDRITIGAAYEYKNHSFGANASSASAVEMAPGLSAYETSSDRIDIEDDSHTVKAKIGFRLN